MAQLPRRLIRLAAVLAGLLLIGVAVLHLPPVRSRVLDRARAYAEREFGVTLRASSLGYNLFTRSIELRDLSLASPSTDQPFLEADRAIVVLGTGVFRGRITITRISLSRPRVTLVRYADGRVNLPSSRKDGQQASSLQLGIVAVTALSARLDDRVAQRNITLGPLDLSVDTASTSGQPGAFGPGGFTVRTGQVETSGTIAGRLAFDGTRVRIEDLTAETREGRIALTGWADVIGDQPAISARVNATVDVPQAARLASVDTRSLSGHLEGTIDVAGALAAPTVTVSVASGDTRYAPIGPVRLAGRSSFSGGRALIENLDVESAVGLLQVQGVIELGETPPARAGTPSRLTLRWSNLRVDDLVQAYGQQLPIRSGSIASGSGTVDFDARDRSPRAWSRLSATATTTLEPAVNVSSRENLALSGRTDLRVDAGRWSLRHSLQARSTQVELAGDVTGRLLESAEGLRSTLAGRSRIRVADISAVPHLMRDAGVKIPPDVVEGLAGSMLATVDLAGTIEHPLAQIDVEARDVRLGVLPHAAVLDARLDVDASGVRAHDVQGTAGTTSLHVSGKYAWRGPFDARVELSEGNLSELASRFKLPVSVSGSARLEGTMSGTISSAVRSGHGTYALSARELAVEQIPIGPLAATGTFTVANAGEMTVNAEAPAVGARAQLQVANRAGYPVSGEITLEHKEIGALIPPRYRQQTGDLSGELSATARGTGHLSDPAGMRGRIDLRVLDVVARGTRIRLAAPGSITLTDDRIVVNSVDLRVGEHTRATLGGQLGVAVLPDPLRFHVDGPLSELIDIGARATDATPVAVRGDGTATLDVTVAGTLGRPLPSGTLAVSSPSLQYGTFSPVTGLTLDATIDPTLITLRSLVARWQNASLGGEGTVPWRVILSSLQAPSAKTQSSPLAGWLNALPAEPSRARLTIRADDVTEAVLKDVVAAERLEEVQGRATATVTVEADRLSLEHVLATAVLGRASLTLAGVPFTQTVPTRLRLEKGWARITDFQWSAEGNSIVATGEANLAAARPSMDLGVSGAVDLRVLGAFVSGISSGGMAHADLAVTGPFDNPDVIGRITVADGELQVDTPRLAASNLEGTVQIAAGRRVTVSVAGFVNTGKATLGGTLDLANLAAPLGKLQFTGREIALEYPPGLQTESNADIELALAGTNSALTGRIDVLGGNYREALVLSSQLLSLSSTNGIARAAPPAEWLSRIRLNVAVATASDVRIDNNYGRFDIGASLRLVGTLASPGVLGRLQALDGGEIYLGGNTYRIERLAIDLTNPRGITPEVNFSAQTRIGDLPIGIELTCPASGACERKVTSLATGDDAEAEARLFGTAGGAASAGEGLVRLLSGEFLGVVGRSVGLDAIRLEQGAERGDIFNDPTLISGDVDPAARLTLAKRLGSNVELVYSQNLADDGFTWITSYLGPFGLSGRLLVLDDQSRSYEFRHEPPIGARPRPRPRPPGPRIAAVTIAGSPGFPEKEVRRQLRLTEGDRFSFGAWQRDRDRLGRFYQTQGFLEARIRARRLPADREENPGTPADDKVVLEYRITRGPTTRLTIKGATLPDAVRDRIAERWSSVLFDGFLERDARTIVREHLYRQGYLSATVSTAIALDAARDVKTLTIEVTPGAIVPSRIEVTGNSALRAEQLLGIASQDDALAAWLDPGSVERLLENHYRSEGFLAADVSVGMPEIRDSTSVVTVRVVEGAAYSIGQTGLGGLPELPEQDVREALALAPGDRYRPGKVAEAIDRLEGRLRQSGYRQARADVDTRVDAKAARVDIDVRITPGPRSILRDVVVQGADATKPPIARSIVLAPNAPLDPTSIRETRRRLYELDVFRSVDIQVKPLATSPASGPVEQPVVATIVLEERPRYRVRYGLAVSDEEIGTDERDRRLGFAADLENRNIFGRGARAGVSLRLRRDQQVGRLTVGANRLFGLPLRSTMFVERKREQLSPEGAFPITSDISAFTAEQAYRLRRALELRYGYGVEKNHTFIRSDQPDAFDLTVKVARFTTSGLVDRRDDAFNPARGWFLASTLELSTPTLGSDLRFLKDFAQYSHFVPIGRTFVVASAARFGAARTFDDQVLIPSERFYAGGANSVRGYREDDLGARSVFDDAEGGSALLVLNGELRFPIYRWLKGVGFVDLGNIYPKLNDVSFTDLQIGTGAGARFDTPFGLIRFDLGIPVNRRAFDPRWRIHIGFGQAF